MSNITIAAAGSLDEFNLHGPAATWEGFETIKKAKDRAQYVLTREYANVAEMSEPFGYAQVIVDGEVHSDFFSKEAANPVTGVAASNDTLPKVVDFTFRVSLSVSCARADGRLDVGPGYTLMISEHHYINGKLDADAGAMPMIFEYFPTAQEALSAAQKHAANLGIK